MLRLKLVHERILTPGARGPWSAEVVDEATKKIVASTDFEATQEEVLEVVRDRFALTTTGIILTIG